MFAGRGHSVEPGLTRRPPSHVLEQSAQAKNRSKLLQRHVAQTAQAVQSAAADTAALLERRAEFLGQPGRIDYPTETKSGGPLPTRPGKWPNAGSRRRDLARLGQVAGSGHALALSTKRSPGPAPREKPSGYPGATSRISSASSQDR